MTFALHPQLEKDTIPVAAFPLSAALLMDNALFPWLILVPRRPFLVEIMDLLPAERAALMEEIHTVAAWLKREFQADKINIATLGNQVPQLHVHIIARFQTDEAWPSPVWGKGGRAYTAEEKTAMLERLSGLSLSI